jgi:hypothetical protein
MSAVFFVEYSTMNRRIHRLISESSRGWLGSLALAALVLAGCSGDGLDRQRVHGTVTYQGKPVEFGAIFFEPTASVGKVAPTVYLPIRDGKYDTGREGPVRGKYRVVVGGHDQSKTRVDDDGITHTTLLFPDYRFEVEIPPPNNTLDVEVPATASRKK